ncbi:MAG: hypothetical protein HKL82_06965 [Acidimicrobiaceae bacterium]|nr:hypothetical protein [Acidimicrobiaceae bacterium]
MSIDPLFDMVIELDLQPAGGTGKNEAVTSRNTVKGPFDRRITAGRRISVTSLDGLRDLQALCVLASPNLLKLTTKFVLNAPTVVVRKTRAGRLELDFTKGLRRMLIDARLDPTVGKSIPIDVYLIKRGRHFEFECVRRGKGRPI